MKRILMALAVISAFFAQPVSAVTDKEMEEARAITAQAYLRYANDASGYLDEIKATSISDLRPKLKKQEIENLKAFNAVATPRDYASWDKKKLVEYWSVTFFNSPGLSEKGRNGGAKSRVKRKIEAMTVSAPEASKTTDKETAEGMEAPTKSPADIAEAPDEAVVAGADSVKAIADSLQQTQKQLDEAPAAEEAVKKGSSHTWIYIIILVILVGVVIWLVIFASNVMKRRPDDDDDDDDNSSSRQRRPMPQPSVITTASAAATEEAVAEETSALREKFAATLASKNEEIRTLTRQAEALRQDYESIQQDNLSLRGEIDRWRSEAERLKSELGTVRQAMAEQTAVIQAATARPAVAEEPRRQEPQRPTQPLPAADGIRTIYLGRANNRGIFVRADRNLNVGHTLFRLETADGFAGTFRVANDPTVWEMALMTPVESLAGACVCADFNATDGATRITTLSPGTAIFEGGCWKVIRKAKIAYE